MEPINFNQANIMKSQIQSKPKVSPSQAQDKFANALKTALNDVNDAAIHSDKMTQKLVNGEVKDLHEVMIAAQKGSITRQATIEIRNKVIDAYKEIMRMQV